MNKLSIAVAACGASLAAHLAAPSPAGAQLIDEIRLGVMEHDIGVFNEGAGNTEDGRNLTIEVLAGSPGFLRWALSPRPVASFSWNDSGDTNFGGLGLAWQTPRQHRFFAEAGVGYVIHDGVVELPTDPADPTRIRLANTRVIYGSRDLFRSTFGFGVRVTDRIDAQLTFEHLSHGQILGSGKNEGLDTVGVRLGYHFND